MKEAITFDRFVRMLGTGLLILFIVWLINRLSSVLLPFAVAWLLAYLLYPMVRFVQYRLHVPSRVLSIIVTMLTVIAVIALVVWLIIPPMIEQFQKLSELVAAYIHKSAHISSIPEAIREWIQNHGDDLERILKSNNFSEGVKTADGEQLSVHQVKNAMQEIIDEEDKRHPLSDDAIAALMKQRGFPIARRTVAKYREQLGIPVARMRKI